MTIIKFGNIILFAEKGECVVKTRNNIVASAEKRKARGIRILYIVLVGLVVLTLVRSAVRHEYNHVFFCVLTLILFTLPSLVERKLNIQFPNVFEGIVLIFIYAAEILGEINCYYLKIPHWDTMLHTVNGFMFAAFGFALLDIINQNGRIKYKLSPFYLALMAFCFSMTIGVFWEFFEYYGDLFLGTDMQKDTYINTVNTVILDPSNSNTVVSLPDISEVIIRYEDGKEIVLDSYIDVGLSDTIKDLVVNFIGAFLFSVIGFFYVKQRGNGKIAKQFIPTLKDKK